MSGFPEIDAATEARLARASFFALAGLLHESASAIEAATFEVGGVDRAALRRVAGGHRQPAADRGDEHLLARAQRVASGGDDRGGQQADESRTSVRSVLAELGGRVVAADEAAWLRAAPWDGSLEAIQPGGPLKAAEAAAATKARSESLVRGLSFRADDAAEAVERVQAVAVRLFGAVPASLRRGDPIDVSLLDHARVVAAVAACLSLEHAEPPADHARIQGRYRLIGVAIGGIQSFLFRSVPSIDGRGGGSRGLAKVLRGRSFFVGLLSHLAARRILAEVGLPMTNLLIEAGGRATLLVPDDADSARRAGEAIARCRRWFLETFAGSLRLDIGEVAGLADGDLSATKVPATLRRLGDAMEASRLRLPVDRLRSTDGGSAVWSDDGWILPSLGNPVDAGDLHDRIVAFGRRIPRGRALEIGTPSRPPRRGEAAIDLFGFRVAVSGEVGGESDGVRLAFDVASDRLSEPTLMVANHVPRYTAADPPDESDFDDGDEPRIGDPVTFDRLAGRSVDDAGQAVGGEMLAAIKADVDRLGMLGAYGLGERASLARMAGFSRLLDQFFKCGLGDLLRRDFPNLYTVYAGGDDLFLVGPWFDVVRFARRLRAEFARLVAGNPKVTLSAGIAIGRGTTPIRDLAAHADTAVELAKDSGRDRITIFGVALDWKQYGAAIELAGQLVRASEDEGLPSGLVYRLLQYGKSAQRLARGETVDGDAGWRAHLNYDLRRNYPIRDGASPLRSGIHRELMSIRGSEAVRLKVAATLALYQLRGASLAAARGDES